MENEILGTESFEVNRDALALALGHDPNDPEFWRVEMAIASAIRDAELKGWSRGYTEGRNQCL